MFYMNDAGLTVSVAISKAGAAFGAAAGAVTEVAYGWYKVSLTAGDTNTLGDLAYQCTAPGADPCAFADQVGPAPVDEAAIADKLLGRNIAGGSDGGRTVTSALRSMRNKVDTVSVPGKAIFYQEDDIVEDHRRDLTSDALALPIVTADPTT
jgi:hypothetical protein